MNGTGFGILIWPARSAETVPSDSGDGLNFTIPTYASGSVKTHNTPWPIWFVRKLHWLLRSPRETFAMFIHFALDGSRIITEACVDSFESFFRRWSPTTSFLWAGGRKVKRSVIMHSFGYRGYRICCSLLSNPCQRMPLYKYPMQDDTNHKKTVTQSERLLWCRGPTGVL